MHDSFFEHLEKLKESNVNYLLFKYIGAQNWKNNKTHFFQILVVCLKMGILKC